MKQRMGVPIKPRAHIWTASLLLQAHVTWYWMMSYSQPFKFNHYGVLNPISHPGLQDDDRQARRLKLRSRRDACQSRPDDYDVVIDAHSLAVKLRTIQVGMQGSIVGGRVRGAVYGVQCP